MWSRASEAGLIRNAGRTLALRSPTPQKSTSPTPHNALSHKLYAQFTSLRTYEVLAVMGWTRAMFHSRGEASFYMIYLSSAVVHKIFCFKIGYHLIFTSINFIKLSSLNPIAMFIFIVLYFLFTVLQIQAAALALVL
jgi:hypothetical protein